MARVDELSYLKGEQKTEIKASKRDGENVLIFDAFHCLSSCIRMHVSAGPGTECALRRKRNLLTHSTERSRIARPLNVTAQVHTVNRDPPHRIST